MFLSLLWVPPGVTNPSTRRDLLVCAHMKCKEEINGTSEEKQVVFWSIFQLQYCQAQDTKIMSVGLQILIYIVNICCRDFLNSHFSISVFWTRLLTHLETMTVFVVDAHLRFLPPQIKSHPCSLYIWTLFPKCQVMEGGTNSLPGHRMNNEISEPQARSFPANGRV